MIDVKTHFNVFKCYQVGDLLTEAHTVELDSQDDFIIKVSALNASPFLLGQSEHSL